MLAIGTIIISMKSTLIVLKPGASLRKESHLGSGSGVQNPGQTLCKEEEMPKWLLRRGCGPRSPTHLPGTQAHDGHLDFGTEVHKGGHGCRKTVLPEQIQTCALVKEANSGFMSWTRRPALTAWAGSQKQGSGTTTETLFWSFVRLGNMNED